MMRVAIVYKEIDTCGVSNAFERNEDDGPEGDALTYGRDDIKDGPTQKEIEQERGLGKAVEEKDLEKDASKGEEPYNAECRPASHEMIVLDNAHTDGRIARRNENVDGTMVKDAEIAFAVCAGTPPMIHA